MNNKLLRGAFCAAVISSAVLISGCGVSSSAATDAARKKTTLPPGQSSGSTNATTTTTTTTPTTTTTTTASGAEPVVSPNGIKGEFDVADNFNIASTLTPTIEVVPASSDPVGAFRFTCLAGQLSHDDPIVYPGQPGKSHLHQFFGNTATNANSTYQSLRTTGGSTCTRSTDVSSQRSAYWEPAMLDGAGNVVKPNFLLTYYKNFPATKAECQGAPDATHMGWCIPMPNGIRFITGYNMDTGTGSPTDSNDRMYWAVAFECLTPDQETSLSGVQHSIADVVATGKCVSGGLLRAGIALPNCWDGKYLDTADHRSHMVYGNGALIENFGPACTADHPYALPQIALQTFYTIDANFLAGKWHYASDEMTPGKPAGYTFHADYWEAWSPVVKNDWQTGCIDKQLSCNVGELGNGQSVKGMSQDVPYPTHILVLLASILI
jgi:Domain of unknown function (DUF1996)